jgi:hypothetical protein
VGEAAGLDVAVDGHDASGGRSLGAAVGHSRRHWTWIEGWDLGSWEKKRR